MEAYDGLESSSRFGYRLLTRAENFYRLEKVRGVGKLDAGRKFDDDLALRRG